MYIIHTSGTSKSAILWKLLPFLIFSIVMFVISCGIGAEVIDIIRALQLHHIESQSWPTYDAQLRAYRVAETVGVIGGGVISGLVIACMSAAVWWRVLFPRWIIGPWLFVNILTMVCSLYLATTLSDLWRNTLDSSLMINYVFLLCMALVIGLLVSLGQWVLLRKRHVHAGLWAVSIICSVVLLSQIAFFLAVLLIDIHD